MEEQTYTADQQEFDFLRLLGFSELEAARLIYMKGHIYEETEYREILQEKRRLSFLRWLIDHERLSG